VPVAVSADSESWTETLLAELDTAAAVPLMYPYPSPEQAEAWNLSEEHVLTLDPAAGAQVKGFGNLMYVRLFEGANTIVLRVPVYFVPKAKVALVGLELISAYFEVHALPGGDWELTLRPDYQKQQIALRADHLR
jgi:hypothetical protein